MQNEIVQNAMNNLKQLPLVVGLLGLVVWKLFGGKKFGGRR